jgi:polyisoprenoid-binding protein YceI
MMRYLKVHLCMSIALLSTSPADGQSPRTRIDPHHSTASLFLQKKDANSPPLNVGIAMVSGTANWDHSNVAKSEFRLHIYPANQDSRLLESDGSFRKGGIANLSRYTLMTFQSRNSTLDPSGKLIVTGELTVTYVEREASAEWSVAYTGAEKANPSAQTLTHEVRLIVADGSTAPPPNWPSVKPDLVATTTTSAKEFKGIRRALVNAVWPIVVLDERCAPPPGTASADVRGYQGANCSSVPVLTVTSSQMPAWTEPGYFGSKDQDPTAADQVTIVMNLRLLETKQPGAIISPE